MEQKPSGEEQLILSKAEKKKKFSATAKLPLTALTWALQSSPPPAYLLQFPSACLED